MTNRPALLILVYWIYIYISSTDGTLNGRPMNDNLRIVALCCLPGSNSGRRQFSDNVRSRPTSLYMITLVMIWLRVLPHGMDGCSPQFFFFFFGFIFRFSDFSVAFVSRRGGFLCWISNISNQLIYFLSLGFFFLQSNIAYVVLISIFRLRDGYMSWLQ